MKYKSLNILFDSESYPKDWLKAIIGKLYSSFLNLVTSLRLKKDFNRGSDKRVLCCFGYNISAHTKFHQNRTEIEIFCYYSVLIGRAGRSKNGSRYFESILCCF